MNTYIQCIYLFVGVHVLFIYSCVRVLHDSYSNVIKTILLKEYSEKTPHFTL